MDDEWYQKLERMEASRTEYARELAAFSRLLIALAVSVLGFSVAQLKASPRDLGWLIAAWLALLASSLCGFAHIYAFSRRFKWHAEYLHKGLLADTVMELTPRGELAGNPKFDEFIWLSERAKGIYDRHEKIALALVGGEAATLMAGIGLWAASILRLPQTPV